MDALEAPSDGDRSSSPRSRRPSALGRGAAFFAGLGGVLGGLAGTVQWPVVATFFGAIEGALAGVVVGIVVGAALAAVARRTRSRWAARGISAAIAGAAVVAVAVVWTGQLTVPRAGVIALVPAATLIGGALGPLVAFGAEPAAQGRFAGLAVGGVLGRFLGWGAGLGAGIGAVVGLFVGIRAYLPTAPFAVGEGAVLGVVSGLVLACLLAGVALLPRVRVRR